MDLRRDVLGSGDDQMTNPPSMLDVIPAAGHLATGSDRLAFFVALLSFIAFGAIAMRYLRDQNSALLAENGRLQEKLLTVTVQVRDALAANAHALEKMSQTLDRLRNDTENHTRIFMQTAGNRTPT